MYKKQFIKISTININKNIELIFIFNILLDYLTTNNILKRKRQKLLNFKKIIIW